VGVYLKSGANIRYSVTTSYTIDVTCEDAFATIVTSSLVISIDPNNAPDFSDFQGNVVDLITYPLTLFTINIYNAPREFPIKNKMLSTFQLIII